MGEKTTQTLERSAHLLKGEESEGALMRIADTLEEVAKTLETALDIENEHGLTYQVWRVRKALESISGQSYD